MYRGINGIQDLQGVSENTDTFVFGFEALNVCQGTCSLHERKEGFLEICLTPFMLAFVRSYNCMKEKAKTLQFQF